MRNCCAPGANVASFLCCNPFGFIVGVSEILKHVLCVELFLSRIPSGCSSKGFQYLESGHRCAAGMAIKASRCDLGASFFTIISCVIVVLVANVEHATLGRGGEASTSTTRPTGLSEAGYASIFCGIQS